MNDTRRRLLAAALMAGMAYIASMYALQGVMLSNLIAYYDLKGSAQGLSASAMSVGGVAALVISLFLVGRVRKQVLLWVGLGICAALLMCLSFLPPFWAFVGIWLVAGMGLGLIDTLLSSSMADLYPGASANRMMCLLHTLFCLSSIITPVIFRVLMNGGMAWNRLYLWVGAVGVAIIAYFVLSDRLTATEEDDGVSDARVPMSGLKGIMKGGVLPALAAAMFCHGLFLGSLSTWINRYLETALNSSLSTLGMSALYLGLMASRLILPGTKISSIKYVRVCGILAFAFLAAGVLSHNAVVMLIMTALCSLCFGAMLPYMLNIGCASAKVNTMAVTTLLFLACYIGQSLGSPMVGAMGSAVSLDAGMLLCGAFIALASLFCMAAKMKKDA